MTAGVQHPATNTAEARLRAACQQLLEKWRTMAARYERYGPTDPRDWARTNASREIADDLAAVLAGEARPYDAEREGRTLFAGLLNPAEPQDKRAMALAFLRLWANSYLLKGNYWDVPHTMGAALNQVIAILDPESGAVPPPPAEEPAP